MTENKETKQLSDFAKIPPLLPIIAAVAMFWAAVWGGGEIARGEIAQLQLDLITAKGRLVKAKLYVPPGAVVTAEMLEEIGTYANRVEPYCFNKASAVIGKKTKYGLEAGQVLTAKDVE